MFAGLFWAALAAFSLDRFTKMLVVRRLALGQGVAVASWLRIRRVANRRGVALRAGPRTLFFVLAALGGGICLTVQQGDFFQHPGARIGLGLALGGAAGNFVDQLRHGAVVDFVDLSWWPVFNLADAAIGIGVIITLCFLF